MRKILYLLMLSLSVTLFSCDDAETEDISRITYYPDFVLTGGEIVRHQVGTAYTEPGVIAKEGDNELEVTTTGEVDANTMGIYEINYAATNIDGFDGNAKRFVVVTDMVDDSSIDLSGVYTLDKGGFVPMDADVKIKPGGYYDMSSFYGYEATYGNQYKMAVRIVYLTTDKVVLVPMTGIFGNYLTAEGDINADGDMSFVVSRNNTPWSTRVWRKQ